MLVAFIVGLVVVNVSMNFLRAGRAMFKTQYKRSVKADLAGWQLLDAVVALGMVALFLAERYNAALVYMATSFYLTLLIPRKTLALVVEGNSLLQTEKGETTENSSKSDAP